MKKNQSFMVVTSDNWLEVWSIGYSSREKAHEKPRRMFIQKQILKELRNEK